ncbi:efflux RND transporter permease subunit [bacterium]|nr:efflux RND transporter permease subunit [bacterium]
MKDDLGKRGPVAWMASNRVAANLLMIFLLGGGFLASLRIKQEVFPEFDLDMILISVAYPGASPAEVEQGIVLAIEEQVRGLDGVDRVTASASEGVGIVSVELLLGADADKALQDIRNAVDRIITFPEDAERPQIQLLTTRREVISLVIYGNHEERLLRDIVEQVRDEILQKPDITLAELAGVRPLEISIEIPKETLRAHNLTLQNVANQVRRAAVELPGGGVKTRSGEILLRMAERRDWGREYADIPIVSRADGTELRLGDIATIIDGFADIDMETSFNGKPAVMLDIYRVGDQSPIEVADAAKSYVKQFRSRLPEGLNIEILRDWSDIYRQRMDLLLRNAYLGLVLVMFLLGLFLEIRLAFWVMMGIPTSFLGSLIILPQLGVTINMISLFAFITALGMVVDDAIVVGENIYKNRQMGMPLLKAAISGVHGVAVPVIFAILTNIAAFMPLLFVPGTMGKFFKMIPAVVIVVFALSLVEALFILPAHLSHHAPKKAKGLLGLIDRIQNRTGRGMEWFIETLYRPFLRLALRYRYVTLSAAISILAVVLSLVSSGRVGMVPRHRVEADRVRVSVELPFGSPVEETRKVQERLVKAAERVIARNGGNEISEGILTRIGAGSRRGGPMSGSRGVSGQGHVAQIRVHLVPADQREISTRQFARRWREQVGEIAGLEMLDFDFDLGGAGGGKPINIQLSHPDIDILERAAAELADELQKFNSASQIDDGFSAGKPQLDLSIRPEAQSLGLTTVDIGRQLRNSFYGAEALRQQRGRNEIKVMVRLPDDERESEDDIEEFLVTTPAGGELPLREAASIKRGNAYTAINRADGRRVVSVTADVDPPSFAARILEDLQARALPQLIERNPGLAYSLEGEQREFNEAMKSLYTNFILAVLAIYAMLAIPLRSYIQPAVVMISIPFGIVGAVIGHLVMGYDLSLISMMGIVALSGVVVNDSLILIDFLNSKRREGSTVFDAAMAAGQRRFRPIILTSLTTFLGLAPMIFETSIQAKFLIPMGISLGYGILFATGIALILVPSLYLIVEDFRALGSKLRSAVQPRSG